MIDSAAHRKTKAVLIIGGPTASGKSGVALAVAEKKDSVIINADSMQVYNALPLLTAQPTADDFASVPHRLYAVIAPDDICSAARWRDDALVEIEKAHSDNKLPIIVGGTGFYMRALLKGLSPIPEVPLEVRARVIARLDEIGKNAFFTELEKIDPAIAKTIDRYNPQRLMRAMEVFEATGKPLSAWQTLPLEGPPAHLNFITSALLPPREVLYSRCNQRFIDMVENGMQDEVAAFAKRIEAEEVPATTPLLHALGYEEILDWLEGRIDKETAIDTAQQTTRNYAKRQVTWFTNQLAPQFILESTDIAPLLPHL